MIIIRTLFILFLILNFHANSQYLSFSTEYKGDDPFLERSFFLIDQDCLELPSSQIDTLLFFLNQINSIAITEFHLNDSPDKFEISLYQYKESQIDLLENNHLQSYISNEFKTLYKEIIFYKYHDFLCQYILINKKNTQLFDYNNIPYFLSEDVYFESLTKDHRFPIYKDYIYHMTLFMVSKTPNINNSIASFANTFFDFSKENLKEDLFIYCVSRFISDYIENIDDNFFLDFIKDMDVYESFLIYKNFLIEKNENSKKNKKNNQYMNESFDDVKNSFYIEDLDGNIASLNDLKGKLLYVDIWASWCGPCKKQFKYTKELKKKLKNKFLKKIEFVYISIDKDYEAWKNAIQKFDIDGDHFISPPNKLDNAGEFFNVSGIPRYIIIDKNGNILDDNAKRPSDEDIIDYLIDFIN